jgi:peptidoglycan/xylan/chitin deacetylase (PgdA/CDA1 family)
MAPPQQQLLTQVARLFPDALFYAPTQEKVVALTIDDIPTPGDQDDGSTRLILNAIAVHNRTTEHPVRATFFVITDHLNPGTTILPEILAAGHEIANHGTTDTTPAILQPLEFERHFREADTIITDLIQQPLRWYRPGRGLYNRSMLEQVRLSAGYESVLALASMIPFDTFPTLDDPTLTTWYLSRFIFPGAIFVMHGGSEDRCRQTAKVLPTLLRILDDQDYRVVTVSELYDRVIAKTAPGPPPPHPVPPPGPPSPPPA